MDEAIIKELESVVKGLRKIRKEVWGQSNLCTLPIDEEIEKLEDVVNQIAYKGNWNGSHPVGQS